jgi:hypothetical protein
MWLARLFSEKSNSAPGSRHDSSEAMAEWIQQVLKLSCERTGVTLPWSRRS